MLELEPQQKSSVQTDSNATALWLLHLYSFCMLYYPVDNIVSISQNDQSVCRIHAESIFQSCSCWEALTVLTTVRVWSWGRSQRVHRIITLFWQFCSVKGSFVHWVNTVCHLTSVHRSLKLLFIDIHCKCSRRQSSPRWVCSNNLTNPIQHCF